MSLRPWPWLSSSERLRTPIFSVHEDTVISPRRQEERRVTRLQTPDWVNMVALTPDEDVVLVRQWRHGTRDFTLEIPGGMVDTGEDAAAAAVRELREETGYTGDEAVAIGVVHPNPAFHDNRCSTYLIPNCRPVGAQQLDAGEDIEVTLAPLAEIPALITSGAITNSLVISAFHWLHLHNSPLYPL